MKTTIKFPQDKLLSLAAKHKREKLLTKVLGSDELAFGILLSGCCDAEIWNKLFSSI